MWTYSADPGNVPRDQVRLLLGDTDPNAPLLQDEEVEWLLEEHGDPYSAAAEGSSIVAGRFAREVDRTVGDFSISAGQKARQYHDLSSALHGRASRTSLPIPYCGGISKSDKDQQRSNSDRVVPFARVNMHAHSDTGPSDPKSLAP